jgi:aspartyl-tRNA(Asn)/glutamyl-tRNA(Gln) amidotransferase subunit B
MQLETIIGLEVHVQLKTASKMFCGCANVTDDAPPNTAVCPVCLGLPGALPAINRHAVELAAKAGLGLGGTVATASKFDRKNYFYPDLPKGYQVSQYDLPAVVGGSVTATLWEKGAPSREFRVRLVRAHLEEDAAKLHHGTGGSTLVDFNRAGTPLLEIVSEPDMRTPEEAKAYLQELRLTLRYLGVSDADMEKGQLRCDANISLRPVGDDKLYTKTEIKNINSFRSVERALDYEIKRQTALWLDGMPPSVSTTRGWDDEKGATVEQRAKESMHDYRYFPEPDLPPFSTARAGEAVATQMPELPAGRRRRYAEEFGFTAYDANVLVDDPAFGDYAEQVVSELAEWLSTSAPALSEADRRATIAKLVAGWLLSKLRGIMTEHKLDLAAVRAHATAENIAELLSLVHAGKITGPNALIVLAELATKGGDPSVIIEQKNLGAMQDTGELDLVARNVIAANPKAVADYRAGQTNVLQFLVGQMMRTTQGKAPPDVARQLLEKALGE